MIYVPKNYGIGHPEVTKYLVSVEQFYDEAHQLLYRYIFEFPFGTVAIDYGALRSQIKIYKADIEYLRSNYRSFNNLNAFGDVHAEVHTIVLDYKLTIYYIEDQSEKSIFKHPNYLEAIAKIKQMKKEE